MNNIDDRLKQIEIKISEKNFIENRGMANDVNYHIFDYEPKEELKVRRHIKNLIESHNIKSDIKIYEFDVYDMMIELLKQEDYFEECINIEKNEGMKHLIDAIYDLLELSSDESYFAKKIDEKVSGKAIVFITGVGKIYPFVRSHKILNNLHLVFDRAPVVMFYPGTYTGQNLELFDKFKDDNYYRAFKLC